VTSASHPRMLQCKVPEADPMLQAGMHSHAFLLLLLLLGPAAVP
jgi:hypothetical protein